MSITAALQLEQIVGSVNFGSFKLLWLTIAILNEL